MSQTSTFYGREQELAEFQGLLDKATVLIKKGKFTESLKVIIGHK